MIVAVIAMGVVQPAIDQITDVIGVRDRLMTAAGTMNMVCFMAGMPEFWRAAIWVFGAHLNRVLFDDVAVLMMQMTVVKVVDMVAVLDCGVTAAGAMLVRMVRVDFCQDASFLGWRVWVYAPSRACSITLSTRSRTCASAIE